MPHVGRGKYDVLTLLPRFIILYKRMVIIWIKNVYFFDNFRMINRAG